eukprot:ANDGO_08096.mRNA.1 hypothetical protein
MKSYVERMQDAFLECATSSKPPEIDSPERWSRFCDLLYSQQVIQSDFVPELQLLIPEDGFAAVTFDALCQKLCSLSTDDNVLAISAKLLRLERACEALTRQMNRFGLDEASFDECVVVDDDVSALLDEIEKLRLKFSVALDKVRQKSRDEWERRFLFAEAACQSRRKYPHAYAFLENHASQIKEANDASKLIKPIVDSVMKPAAFGFHYGCESRSRIPLILLLLPRNQLAEDCKITSYAVAHYQLSLSPFFEPYIGIGSDKYGKQFAMFMKKPDPAALLQKVLHQVGKLQEGVVFRFIARQVLQAFFDLDSQCPLSWTGLADPLPHLFLTNKLDVVIRFWPFQEFVTETDQGLDAMTSFIPGAPLLGSVWLRRSLSLLSLFFRLVQRMLYDDVPLWSCTLRALYEKHHDQLEALQLYDNAPSKEARGHVIERFSGFKYLLIEDLIAHNHFAAVSDLADLQEVRQVLESAVPSFTA